MITDQNGWGCLGLLLKLGLVSLGFLLILGIIKTIQGIIWLISNWDKVLAILNS